MNNVNQKSLEFCRNIFLVLKSETKVTDLLCNSHTKPHISHTSSQQQQQQVKSASPTHNIEDTKQLQNISKQVVKKEVDCTATNSEDCSQWSQKESCGEIIRTSNTGPAAPTHNNKCTPLSQNKGIISYLITFYN